MFVRGGAILPLGPEMNYVGEKPFDPITFAIYPDERGSASTSLYEDDGLSPSYKDGAYRRTTLNVSHSVKGFVVSISAPLGQFNPGTRKFGFIIKSTGAIPKTLMITDDGKARTVEMK